MIKYFYKALRITAIPLVIAGFLTLLSGFTTTKYFIVPGLGYSLSYLIHTTIFPLVFMPLFFVHSLAGTLIIINRHQRINKKPLKMAVVLLWFAILGLFAFLFAAQSPAAAGAVSGINTSVTGSLINNSLPGGAISLSLAEIAKHNSPSDCWIIISGKVYDVTAHLANHPGGAGLITPYCGQDATTTYDTKGGRGSPHSPSADSMLGPIYLGNVGGTVSSQVIQQAQNQTLPNTGGNGREDD
jgi:hypothetical protein